MMTSIVSEESFVRDTHTDTDTPVYRLLRHLSQTFSKSKVTLKTTKLKCGSVFTTESIQIHTTLPSKRINFMIIYIIYTIVIVSVCSWNWKKFASKLTNLNHITTD